MAVGGADGPSPPPPGPCPACRLCLLAPLRVGPPVQAVEIDVCPACQGAFFDAGELDAVRRGDEPVEAGLGPARIPRRPRPCPRGHGPMVERPVIEARGGLVVDVCRTCRGVFLDGSERRRLARATLPRLPDGAAALAGRSLLWLLQLLVHLPVEVRNPTRGRAWFVGLFALAALAVFAARAAGHDVTALALDPAAVHAGARPFQALGTFLTYALVHGSWWHVLGNLYFLYTFGDNVEHVFGTRLFAAYAAAVTVAGAVAYLLTEPADGARLVGASGLVAGVLAAYLWTFPRSRLFHVILFVQFVLPAWVYVTLWAVFQVWMVFLSAIGHATGPDAGVAWSVHAGSFAAGLLLTPLAHTLVRRRFRRSPHP